MTVARKSVLVVAIALILASAVILLRYEAPEPKPRPSSSLTLLSVYDTARAAGASVDGDSVEAILRELMDGVTGRGEFAETTFRVPNLSPEEQETALRELILVDGVLISRRE